MVNTTQYFGFNLQFLCLIFNYTLFKCTIYLFFYGGGEGGAFKNILFLKRVAALNRLITAGLNYYYDGQNSRIDTYRM